MSLFKHLFIFVFLTFFGSCKGFSQEFIVYSENEVFPIIYIQNNQHLERQAHRFSDTFNKKTGHKPYISRKTPSTKERIIELQLVKKLDTAPNGFEFVQKENSIIIRATDEEEMNFALGYFVSTYMNNNIASETTFIKEICIPKNLHYVNIPDFEYREPYFPENFKKEFRDKNMTHTLEEHWGLWGHNMNKVIRKTQDMVAVVDEKPNNEQFCFSSNSLERALISYIKKQTTENPTINRFMIMPNDNSVVCLCDKCQKAGNTKTNASPAVFLLINKLGSKFPNQEFFGTAYITTKNPPLEPVLSNVGVMLSTMDFPKGVVVENSPKQEFIRKRISDWKKVSEKIYLWDYAINFDNYFDPYPTVSIAQKNLIFYKNQGIKGVFMHGNEHDYAVFEDLKCYLYAQLLRNTTIDLKHETKQFLEQNYPEVSDILYNYFTKIENNSFHSNRPLDIYGGWTQSRKKYLNDVDFITFYNAFSNKMLQLKEEYKSYAPMFLAFTFQKLELARTSGIGENGYAFFESGENMAKIYPEITDALHRLKQLFPLSGIERYNESGFYLKDYIAFWESEILKKSYTNLLFGKRVKALTELDEDYSNTKILTDGAVGFNDYYNNWLLCTVTKEVEFEVKANDVREAKELKISFLNAPKNKIYLPESVTVVVGNKKYNVKINSKSENPKYEVSVPINIEENDERILVRITKQRDFKTKSIACDEIIFR